MLAPCLTLALALSACGSEETDGSAPVISALQYSPDTVTAGQIATITGTFTFEDEDADAAQFAVEASLPTGATSEPTVREAQGALGKPTGQMQFGVSLNPQVPGVYTLTIWMIDEAGNESNTLSGNVDAQ